MTKEQEPELVAQFKSRFIPMINDLKRYEKKLGFYVSYMGNQSKISDAYKKPKTT